MGRWSTRIAGPDEPHPAAATAWAAVSVLTLTYTFSFVDRFVLSLLVEPIKADLSLTDMEISLLQGAAFALFYTLAAFPLGRMVDSGSRTLIVAGGITLWSVMTAASALATEYWHLLVARIGVGIGEAALVPAAYSMIADYFPRHRLGTALAVFSLGASAGAGLAFMLGGYIVELVMTAEGSHLPLLGLLAPWQLVFLVVGLPGLFVAVLMVFQPDPPRRVTTGAARPVPLSQVLQYLRANLRSTALILIGQGASAFAAYAILGWTPAALMRVRGWGLNETGYWIGASILVAGTGGVLVGGWLGDRAVSRGHVTGRFVVSIWALAVAAVGAATFPLASDRPVTVALFCLTIFACFMTITGGAAALQEMYPSRMRGQASALYLLATSILGIAAGPAAVALMTDHVFGDRMALPYSLAITAPIGLMIGVACFLAVRPSFARSLEHAKRWPQPAPAD